MPNSKESKEEVKVLLTVAGTGMEKAAEKLQSNPEVVKKSGEFKGTIDTNIKDEVLKPNAERLEVLKKPNKERLEKGNVDNGPDDVQKENKRPTPTPTKPSPRGTM